MPRKNSWIAVMVMASLASAASAQVIEFVPVSSTGPSTIVGNEITLPAGGAQVQFDIMISGWGDAAGSPNLGSISATLDPSGLLGANALPPRLGFDLGTPAQDPCANDGQCPNGFCGSFQPGFCDASQPAYQIRKNCLADPSIVCSVNSQCPGGVDCLFDGFGAGTTCDGLQNVTLPPSGEITWVAACQTPGIPDPGVPVLYGSLRIDVPTDVGGTYAISFVDSVNNSFMTDEIGTLIFGVTLVPGTIKLPIIPDIPAASHWGLLIMTFGLMIVGTLMLRGRNLSAPR